MYINLLTIPARFEEVSSITVRKEIKKKKKKKNLERHRFKQRRHNVMNNFVFTFCTYILN